MIPLAYQPHYNITAFGLERLHPFDSRKYRRIHDALVARGLRRREDFVRPHPVSEWDRLALHTTEYLEIVAEQKRPTRRGPDAAVRDFRQNFEMKSR
jgi:acetoin utilization deacetylase AcuC-like enzyme